MNKFTSSRFMIPFVVCAGLGMFAGCPPQPAPPAPCASPPVDEHRSLVVHMDPASDRSLADRFSLRRTLSAIAAGGTTATTPEALLDTMLDSFEASSLVQPLSGKTLPVDVRQPEADLDPAELLDEATGLQPVGLFNRLDLAPADGSDCGEYRIVYGKSFGFQKFFIIFESKLPNPVAASGIAGCQPVAKFWADLSANNDTADRLSKLEAFYYSGLPGTSFGAVVKLENFGLPLGQVRTNLFMKPLWDLREHRAGLDAGRAVFVVDSVKESPVAQLYGPTVPAGFNATEQGLFRAHFLGQPVCNLVRPDRAVPGATPFDVINGIGGGFDDFWDDVESISQTDQDNPAAAPSSAMIAGIDARLADLGVSGVTSQQLLHRAGAMTCGGCHKFSSGKDLGGGSSNVWPSDAGFVHITAEGDLSQALTAAFLPARKKHLERFVCDPTPEPKPEADCPPGPDGAATAPPLARAAVSARAPEATVDTQLLERLNAERPAPIYREFDRIRAEWSAAAQDARGARTAEARSARRVLDDAVRRAKAEDSAKPGAFMPVRRVH
jgi:hypothetical protein